MKDFTLKKYELFCETISKSPYDTLTFEQYFSQKNSPKNCILLRHDVDRNIENALKMAVIEHRFNLVSTYYCRKTERVFKPEYFKKIIYMGHEIGYHYETLDKAKGNEVEAINIFCQELKTFREFINIKTVCMHGNPLTPWLNSNIWKKSNFKEFGILGEPYLSLDYKKFVYFTDTGRNWDNGKINVKDVIRNKDFEAYNIMSGIISSTDDLINLIKLERFQQICVNTHPHSWHDDIIDWMNELILQKMKNIGKIGIAWYWKRRIQLENDVRLKRE